MWQFDGGYPEGMNMYCEELNVYDGDGNAIDKTEGRNNKSGNGGEDVNTNINHFDLF